MFLEERHAKILSILDRDGKVLVKQLAELFNVSEDSIRKDLSTLELDGKLKRTYGGAVSIEEKLQMTEANRRRISAVDAKRKIAQAAVNLIRPNQFCFLDISTISIAIAQILEKSSATFNILTNMIDVLVMLARNPNIRLTFAGGLLNGSRDGFSGALNLEFIERFRPDISFIGTTGVHFHRNSLSCHKSEEGVHKARMIELSKSTYIVAESAKLGVECSYCFSELSDVEGVITDAEVSGNLAQQAERLGVKIITAA